MVFKVRDLGVAISDRRAVKMLKLLAASALLSGRDAANPSDLWVLRYVWDRVEQIDPLAALVNGVLDRHRDEPAAHPLAAVPERVDAEDLARQLEAAEARAGRGPDLARRAGPAPRARRRDRRPRRLGRPTTRPAGTSSTASARLLERVGA